MSRRLFKMGNRLAVQLPAAVVEALNLQEGDHIEITLAGERHVKVGRDSSRESALQRLRDSKWKLPAGFKFDRAEATNR